MSGFKNQNLNRKIYNNVLKKIIKKIIICCDTMHNDLSKDNKKINNLEEDIRDYLFENYLNNDEFMKKIDMDEFRFFSEVPVKYVNNKPKGRIDLQVFHINDFSNRKRYFTIECKRIDGSKKLNRYYIENGICRFVKKDTLYESFFKHECMLAFVVKEIDIKENIKKINDLQSEYKDINLKKDFSKTEIKEKYDYTYQSTYEIEKNSEILIYHIFYDFNSIINMNKN